MDSNLESKEHKDYYNIGLILETMENKELVCEKNMETAENCKKTDFESKVENDEDDKEIEFIIKNKELGFDQNDETTKNNEIDFDKNVETTENNEIDYDSNVIIAEAKETEFGINTETEVNKLLVFDKNIETTENKELIFDKNIESTVNDEIDFDSHVEIAGDNESELEAHLDDLESKIEENIEISKNIEISSEFEGNAKYESLTELSEYNEIEHDKVNETRNLNTLENNVFKIHKVDDYSCATDIVSKALRYHEKRINDINYTPKPCNTIYMPYDLVNQDEYNDSEPKRTIFMTTEENIRKNSNSHIIQGEIKRTIEDHVKHVHDIIDRHLKMKKESQKSRFVSCSPILSKDELNIIRSKPMGKWTLKDEEWMDNDSELHNYIRGNVFNSPPHRSNNKYDKKRSTFQVHSSAKNNSKYTKDIIKSSITSDMLSTYTNENKGDSTNDIRNENKRDNIVDYQNNEVENSQYEGITNIISKDNSIIDETDEHNECKDLTVDSAKYNKTSVDEMNKNNIIESNKTVCQDEKNVDTIEESNDGNKFIVETEMTGKGDLIVVELKKDDSNDVSINEEKPVKIIEDNNYENSKVELISNDERDNNCIVKLKKEDSISPKCVDQKSDIVSKMDKKNLGLEKKSESINDKKKNLEVITANLKSSDSVTTKSLEIKSIPTKEYSSEFQISLHVEESDLDEDVIIRFVYG